MNPLLLFWMLRMLNDEDDESGASYTPSGSDDFMSGLPTWGAVLLGILLGLLPLGIGVLLVHLT